MTDIQTIYQAPFQAIRENFDDLKTLLGPGPTIVQALRYDYRQLLSVGLEMQLHMALIKALQTVLDISLEGQIFNQTNLQKFTTEFAKAFSNLLLFPSEPQENILEEDELTQKFERLFFQKAVGLDLYANAPLHTNTDPEYVFQIKKQYLVHQIAEKTESIKQLLIGSKNFHDVSRRLREHKEKLEVNKETLIERLASLKVKLGDAVGKIEKDFNQRLSADFCQKYGLEFKDVTESIIPIDLHDGMLELTEEAAPSRKTLLFSAVERKDHATARHLLSGGANMDYMATDGETPLTTVLKSADPELLEIFASHKIRMSEYPLRPEVESPSGTKAFELQYYQRIRKGAQEIIDGYVEQQKKTGLLSMVASVFSRNIPQKHFEMAQRAIEETNRAVLNDHTDNLYSFMEGVLVDTSIPADVELRVGHENYRNLRSLVLHKPASAPGEYFLALIKTNMENEKLQELAERQKAEMEAQREAAAALQSRVTAQEAQLAEQQTKLQELTQRLRELAQEIDTDSDNDNEEGDAEDNTSTTRSVTSSTGSKKTASAAPVPDSLNGGPKRPAVKKMLGLF